MTKGAVTLPDNESATDMYEAMIEVKKQEDPSVLGTKPIADWVTDDVVWGRSLDLNIADEQGRV